MIGICLIELKVITNLSKIMWTNTCTNVCDVQSGIIRTLSKYIRSTEVKNNLNSIQVVVAVETGIPVLVLYIYL